MSKPDYLPAAYEIATTRQPPAIDYSAPAPNLLLSGAVLAVGLKRELREELRCRLHELGLMAIATSSEILALELMHQSDIFDAIVVEGSGLEEVDAAVIPQLRARHANLPIVVVTEVDNGRYVPKSCRHPNVRGREGSITALAQSILDFVALDRQSKPRESGVLQIAVPTVADLTWP